MCFNLGTKFRFFRLKYRLSIGPKMILPTNSRLATKSEKIWKNRQNIINSRYVGEKIETGQYVLGTAVFLKKIGKKSTVDMDHPDFVLI